MTIFEEQILPTHSLYKHGAPQIATPRSGPAKKKFLEGPANQTKGFTKKS